MGVKSFDSRQLKTQSAQPGALTTARGFFLLLSALAVISLPRLVEQGKFSGQYIGSYSLQWVILLAINFALALAGFAILFLLFSRSSARWGTRVEHLARRLSSFGMLNWLGVLIPWAAFVLLVLWRYEKHYNHFQPRVWLFWLVVGLGAFFLMAAWKRPLSFFTALLAVSVLYGASIKVLGFFPDVSAFPFSLSWSEASRYYYASLPYAQRLYNLETPLSFLHPTRYFLLGLPFLINEHAIWLHRLWQVLLWVVLNFLTGWVLARRFKLGWSVTFLIALWGALFMLQGPVYYHLLVCVILVLWGFNREKFWQSLVVVVLASAWAGISRVNWMPVPAMLAIALYLLERPVCSAPSLPRYLMPPVGWGAAGLAAALASQAAYVFISGNEDPSAFGSSFTSALLWYRLLPNPTYPMGVLPATLLVSIPLLVVLVVNWASGKKHWHPIRLLGLSAMLLVLFLGGLLVSTKIGGGSNIHNMDAFLALFVLVGAVVALGRFASETGQPPRITSGTVIPARVWLPWPILFLVVLTPVVWNIDIGDPFVRRDFAQANFDLDKLNNFVQEYAAKGDVLFITQRQLAVFDMVPGVRLVPDYELMTLTEMSMANNQPYLDRFYEDLRSHRFVLIVSDRQQQSLQDPTRDSFAEENNAWVTNVSKPMLQYYQSELFLDTQGIDLLVPKP